MADFEATFSLKGAKEMERALLELGGVPAGRVGQNAVRVGARVFARKARENLRANGSVESGRLVGSVRVRDDRERPKGERTAFAGTTVFYGRFLEFGTAHASAKPFLRPAVDEGAKQAIDRMGENLGKSIEREVAKIAAKNGTVKAK